MFDCLFGWRKASKCKKLIRRVQRQLKLMKSERQSNKTAKHLFNEETVVALYELLEKFCEFIISQLSYIRRTKDIPNDINEAVSTLIFASDKCGVPELHKIRKLFRERYGERFETRALELLPGNLVNLKVIEIMKESLSNEQSKESCNSDNIPPSVSLLKSPNHVHPKLSDYDDIVAKCMTLKKDHQQTKNTIEG